MLVQLKDVLSSDIINQHQSGLFMIAKSMDVLKSNVVLQKYSNFSILKIHSELKYNITIQF